MTDLRTSIDQWIQAGAIAEARAGLGELLAAEGLSNATAGFVNRQYEAIKPQLLSAGALTPYRVTLLRSFTVEPLIPLLRAQGLVNGLDLEIQAGAFNVYAQEMLDEHSALYRSAPQAVILAVETRSIAPELSSEYTDLNPGGSERVVNRVVQQYSDWVGAFRRHSDGHLILHTLDAPASPALGVFDEQNNLEMGQRAAIAEINRRLGSLARDHRGVYTLDYGALVARFGQEQWYDEKKWLSVGLPIAASSLPHLARLWLRYLQPLSGRVAKVAVVDLDNTLWGGIVAEDGAYPGAAHRAFQRALLDLTRRGILLAIASKNNPADALEVLENHPEMLLRRLDFAAMRINWNEKPQSLREIAAELNVGVDSLAFLDDNPVERHRVRTELPEVMVLDLAEDPMHYATQVRDCPFFERLSLSEEDSRRTEYYSAEKRRHALMTSCATREDFLRSLEQTVEIAPVCPATLARVAQLTQKTNQFNSTTRRYSEPQVEELAVQLGIQIWSVRVTDRYCDNGLVGVVITRAAGEVREIDTMLLSCRVIGRGVETALLAHVADQARQSGNTRLEGWFLPTKKNLPAQDFYPSHGFRVVRQEPHGTLWRIELVPGALPWPHWIERAAMTEVTF